MMAVGFVKGFEGTQICGFVAADSAICNIGVADAEGNVVGHVVAKRLRHGAEHAPYNFSFAVETGLPDTNAVRVFANGYELAGSPLKLGAGKFDGSLEIRDGNIRGWIQERTHDAPARRLDVRDQYGRLIESVKIAQEQGSLSPSHFEIDVPRSLLGFREVGIYVECEGEIFAKTTGSFPVEGYLDTLQPGRVAGWALVPGDPSQKIHLDVRIDGKTVASAICEQLRSDLIGKYPQASEEVLHCGFDVNIPDWDDTSIATHTFSLCVAESDVEIFAGPHTIADLPWSVRAVRKAGELIGRSTELSVAERLFVQHNLATVIGRFRDPHAGLVFKAKAWPPLFSPRLSIIIPVYRDVDVTVDCINSVLAHRCESSDTIIVINDKSPDAAMAGVLEATFGRTPNLWILSNPTNRGFVGTVNRGLGMARLGDVLLLNSDTEFFDGGIEELVDCAMSSETIGTVTPLSNNATIFSYPHSTLPVLELPEMAWSEVAASMLAQPRRLIDVPTGHGFCLYIKREVLDAIGHLDEVFGRGYGEENDFCQRAADLGFRNVAATSVFVRHRESVSFGDEKDALRAKNLVILRQRYPEYQAFIEHWQAEDPLRIVRWTIDRERLRRMSDSGVIFVLSVENDMVGGTIQARDDIENNVGFGERVILRCRAVGATIHLRLDTDDLLSVYQLSDVKSFFETLASAAINLCVVHQLLGYDEAFIEGLTRMLDRIPGIFFVHDFYTICPRITMIDAADRFCGGAFKRCDACISVGGAHERSALVVAPDEHRWLFDGVLLACRHVIAPSKDTARRMENAFPGLKVEAIPHPESVIEVSLPNKERNRNNVVALGAIGRHKGSRALLELATIALMDAPDLQFHIVGHTDIDHQFKDLKNVVLHGRYNQESLPRILNEVNAASAIFLHQWPETYSYTLSEVIRFGMIPIAADLGAPAERICDLSFGKTMTFPVIGSNALKAVLKIQNQDHQFAVEQLNRHAKAAVERMFEILLEGG